MSQYWDPVPAVLSHVYAEPLSGIDLLGYLLYFTHYTDHRPDSPTRGWSFPSRDTIKDAMHIGAATLARLDTIASAFGLVERRTTRHHTLRRILPPLDPDTLLQHLDQGLLPIIPKNTPMPTRLMLQAAAARLRTRLLARHHKSWDPQEGDAETQEAATPTDSQPEPPAPPVQPEPPAPQESATIPPAPRPTASAPSVLPQEAPTAPGEARPEPAAPTKGRTRTQTPVITLAPRPAPRIPTEPPAPAVQAPQTTPREAPAVAATPAAPGPCQDVSRPSGTAVRPSQDATIRPSWDPKYPNELKYPNPTPANPITAPGGGGEALSLLGQIRALGQRLEVNAGGLCSALGRCLAGPDLAYVIEHLPEELRPGWRQRARDPLAYLIGVGRRLVAQREAETLLDALPPEPAAPKAEPSEPTEAAPEPEAEPVDTDAPSSPPPGCAADRWAAFLAAARAHLGLRHTPPVLAVLPWRIEGGELRPVVAGTFAEQYAARNAAVLATLAEVWRT